MAGGAKKPVATTTRRETNGPFHGGVAGASSAVGSRERNFTQKQRLEQRRQNRSRWQEENAGKFWRTKKRGDGEVKRRVDHRHNSRRQGGDVKELENLIKGR